MTRSRDVVDMTSVTTLPASTKLAVDRTRLAHERTLMAWIRTAASLISFGFSIYKFFQFSHASQPGAAPQAPVGPREFALIMIGTGVTALVLATIEHRRSMEVLRTEYGHALVPYSIATVIGWLVGGLGLLGLVGIPLRIL
jgi:putative membrane protein